MPLMAAKTREFFPMATETLRFIQGGFHPVMFIQKIRAMVRRFQRGNVVMALLAGERRIDLAVANQAVGHKRKHVGARNILRLLNPMVATRAAVGSIQM